MSIKRECVKCDTIKSLDNFNKKQNYCKECQSEHNKIWMKNNHAIKLVHRTKYRIKNRLQIRQQQKEWKKKQSYAYRKYCGLRNSCRKRKLNYCTQIDFIEWYNKQKKVCVYCGIQEDKIKLLQPVKAESKNLEIDRKDNAIGYSIKNMCLACPDCNKIKNNLLSFSDMQYVGKKMIAPKHKEKIDALGRTVRSRI